MARQSDIWEDEEIAVHDTYTIPFNTDDALGHKYIGTNCPYCQSGNIMAVEQVQCDGNEGSQMVECHDCGKAWYDLWKLKGWMEEP